MNRDIYELDFTVVTNRLKKLIVDKRLVDKIYDKDLASELLVTPSYYAVAKRRQKILYEEILICCFKNNFDIKWVFFGENINVVKI